MKKSTVLAVVGLAPALLAACSRPQAPAQALPAVVAAQPLTQTVTDWDDYAGRFEAVDMVEVRPRVAGAIHSVHFQDGQRVQKGQLLFVIDPRPFEAQMARARADLAGAKAVLANADAELKRAEALIKDRLVSQAQADLRAAAQLQAAASLASAEAAMTTAQLNLAYTRIEAPIAGRVSWRRLAPGNLVAADSTVLTTIVSESPIRFVFDAPEAALLKYRRAGKDQANVVDIRLQDETEYRWKGRVDFLDNALDRSSGTIRARATVPNPDGFLAPGMFGHLRLYAAKPFEALMVPDEAVVTDQTRQVVYVIGPDDQIQQKVVQPGRLLAGLRVITGGLSPEDRVVISGVQRARPGRKVAVTNGTVTAFPSGVSLGETSTLQVPQGGAATTAAPAATAPKK
ncbi:MAG: efflux RND transporter periplasmic adaptor subunit [Proteobacteria bacterium]|nr:efflux RND transporter periplasmic adaptor subunit [Pseudomonadota bacterium]MCC6633454.1 efflux RND transporter periplasmic adaptor subunit [Gammaproteobacteria bacterium]